MIKRVSEFNGLKKDISQETKILKEINSVLTELSQTKDAEEKRMISSQAAHLSDSFKKSNEDLGKRLRGMMLTRSLHQQPPAVKLPRLPNIHRDIHMAPKTQVTKEISPLEKEKPVIKIGRTIGILEKETLRRLGRKEKKIEKKKERKPSSYIRTANKIFGNTSKSMIHKGWFKGLQRDLIKANMQFLARSYLSVILFTTLISVIGAFFIFAFFLFFNFGVNLPFITMYSGNFINRLATTFWILLIIPLGTMTVMYLYPSMEKKSIETKINRELPFATIHMSSISQSMIEPSNIFKIVISTKEYPAIEKEFTKLLNDINVFGHDLVTALRSAAFHSPSRKLSELFDGLATTITSGGALADFFDKRSQTLLFDYKLDKEKQTKSAETFMDIYISVVIAAPMILMLLLIMMRVSGLGISLSTTMISLIMVLGVSVINVIFLVFLQIKQSSE